MSFVFNKGTEKRREYKSNKQLSRLGSGIQETGRDENAWKMFCVLTLRTLQNGHEKREVW